MVSGVGILVSLSNSMIIPLLVIRVSQGQFPE
jgi:hypothetical protein